MRRVLFIAMGAAALAAVAAGCAGGRCGRRAPQCDSSGEFPGGGGTAVAVTGRLHRSFPVAPLSFSGTSMSVGTWLPSAEVTPKEEVRVAVVASWCKSCQAYLRNLALLPRQERPDFIVFYQDEIEAMLDSMEEDDKLDAFDRADIEQRLDENGQLLATPQAVPPDLEVYFIEPGEFEEYVDHYPTLLKCGPQDCEAVE